MSVEQVLDTVERLIRCAGHPDITGVSRYQAQAGPGVAVVFDSLARTLIWLSAARRKPVELPEDLGPYAPRVNYMLKLVTDLLDIAKPPGWSWRTVRVEGVHLAPCGIEVNAGGEVVLLQFTATGALKAKDTDPASFAGWTIPADAVQAAA